MDAIPEIQPENNWQQAWSESASQSYNSASQIRIDQQIYINKN